MFEQFTEAVVITQDDWRTAPSDTLYEIAPALISRTSSFSQRLGFSAIPTQIIFRCVGLDRLEIRPVPKLFPSIYCSRLHHIPFDCGNFSIFRVGSLSVFVYYGC
ncbi:unnamed protein product [Ectocarpus sp. 13 AM-2016]